MPTSIPLSQAAARRCVPARRRVWIAAAALIACCVVVVENGAQQVRTDWAVSGPAPILAGPSAADLRQQMILDNIFFPQARVLQKPPTNPEAAAAPALDDEEDTAWLRFAERPDGADGWRPAGKSSRSGKFEHPPLRQFFSLGSATGQGDDAANKGEVTTAPSAPREESPSSEPGGLPRVELTLPLSAPRNDLSPPSAPLPPTQSQLTIRRESGATIDQDASSDDDEGQDYVPEDVPEESIDADAIREEDDAADIENSESGELSDEPSEESSDEPSDELSDDESTHVPVFELPKQEPLPPLTRQLMNLRGRVRGVLKGYYRKPLNSRDHNPWEVMHGMLAYEVQSRILEGGPRGKPITSAGWLCYNKPCKGQALMHVTRDGKLRAKYGVGLQGHLGQLLAMLAQCHVSPDYPIRVGQHQFTIRDLIDAEQETCYSDGELTFKLLAFQYYLDLDEQWVNERGDRWDIPRLIREELAQPIRGAACGGTHRLSSLSLAVKARVRRGEPLDGEYGRAAEFVRKHHQYAFQLQNRDGSLSTSWFRGRGDESNIDRRIKTSGHILEWLCYSLSDEELRDQRTIRAVSYLANLMYSNYNHDWEVGPVSHATHALLLYDERVFVPYDSAEYSATYRPKPATASRVQQNSTRR